MAAVYTTVPAGPIAPCAPESPETTKTKGESNQVKAAPTASARNST
jgi:hypothetical protein